MRRRGGSNSGARRRGLGMAVALAAVLTTAVMAMAPAAQAAPSRFVYELCDPSIPGGDSPVMSAPFPPGLHFATFETCAQPGGWLGLEQTGAVPVPGQAVVYVPETPGGYVESESMIGNAVGLGTAARQSWVFEQGWPLDGQGELRRSFYLRGEPNAYGDTGDFTIILGCEGTPPCPSGPLLGAHDIAATEVDPNPPALASVTGSLLAPEVLRGHQEIATEVTDVGGGVAKVEVLVNGVPAAEPSAPPCAVTKVANPSYTGVAAASQVPCPASYKASWVLDTASYPFGEGANSVQVCASDFATFGEANRTCSTAQTVTVDDSCTESPVAGGSTLSTTFSRSKKDEVTVPYDTNARVTGELDNGAGEAVAGATICVQLATQGSTTGLAPAGTATTDANGHFVYAVPAGPNRNVLFGYRHDSFEIGDPMRYFAHVKPTIKLSAAKVDNGGAVKITGRLPGGSKAAGRVVVMKASALHSSKWYPFGETTTNGEGVYHYTYRFDATTRTTIYRMEADVPRQDHFPWKAGHSRAALVEVRG